MIVQQKVTMPPPTDEQQEMQQKMMKWMMVIFGLMFYKVAAGLCVYFITSSVWGFAERKLLPKKKLKPGEPSPEGLLQRVLNRGENGANADASSSTAVTTGESRTSVFSASPAAEPRTGGKRRRDRRRRDGVAARAGGAADSAPPGFSGWWQVRKEKLANWWQEILRQAEKKR
jgi:YidC/Oxa1 family membrane protein insertase